MKEIQKHKIHRRLARSVACLLAATLPFLCGCLGTEQQMADAPSASQSKPSPTPAAESVPAAIGQATPKLLTERHAPTAQEVQEAVARSGQNAFMSQGPRFLVGDFNGDGSEDIAVVVKPANGMLAKVNSQYAIWRLEDPHQVVAPDLTRRVQRLRVVPKAVRASDDDMLLMVIHGNGDRGWQDRVNNGIYLLKNATGSNIRLQTLKESLIAISKRPNPAILKGDVIKQTLDGQSGFLLWTGAAYAWYALD
jgi:hypothetical protein